MIADQVHSPIAREARIGMRRRYLLLTYFSRRICGTGRP